MDTVLVFPEAVRDYPWMKVVRACGFEPYFLAPGDARRDARALCQIARRHGARIVHSHFVRYDLPAGLAARAAGGRSIWHIHSGRRANGWRQRASDLVKVRALRGLCQQVIAVSDEVGRQSLDRGFGPDRVRVIHNGIDVARFAQMPSRQQARAELGLSPDEHVALAFCWDPYRKGADVIARAVAHGDVTALLVGGSDDRLREFLGEAEHVRIVAPSDDPRPFFAAADVFVSASRSEGFPYAIGEAMAAGLPVISSDIPEVQGYFDAPAVWRFAPGDDAALGVLLAAHPAPQLGVRNREYVAREHGLAQYVKQMCELFAQLG